MDSPIGVFQRLDYPLLPSPNHRPEATATVQRPLWSQSEAQQRSSRILGIAVRSRAEYQPPVEGATVGKQGSRSSARE